MVQPLHRQTKQNLKCGSVQFETVFQAELNHEQPYERRTPKTFRSRKRYHLHRSFFSSTDCFVPSSYIASLTSPNMRSTTLTSINLALKIQWMNRLRYLCLEFRILFSFFFFKSEFYMSLSLSFWDYDEMSPSSLVTFEPAGDFPPAFVCDRDQLPFIGYSLSLHFFFDLCYAVRSSKITGLVTIRKFDVYDITFQY